MSSAALQAPGEMGATKGSTLRSTEVAGSAPLFYKNHSSCHVEKREQRHQEKGRVAGLVWLCG